MKSSALPTFGAWLKTRRHACDMTQKELARAVGCAEITIRKIQADQLRPSKKLARVLLEKLDARPDERDALMALARRKQRAWR